MGKKVLSVNLTEKSFNRVTNTANALGVSRSELLEDMIKKYKFPTKAQELIDQISELQESANQMIRKEESQTE